MTFYCLGCFHKNHYVEKNTEVRPILRLLYHGSVARGYGQTTEGGRPRRAIDKCGNNHKLNWTHDFWEITCKANEQALERTTALLLKVWSLDL